MPNLIILISNETFNSLHPGLVYITINVGLLIDKTEQD